MASHLVFDLDQTLVNTTAARVFMKTGEGRMYAAQNIDKIATMLFSPFLLIFLKAYHQRGKVSIVTDSPADYAMAVLKKHKFPADLPIFAVAQKPFGTGLRKAIAVSNIPLERTVVVGDSAKDILDAHECKVASIGVTWGKTSAEEQLQKAEPQRIIHTPENLEAVVLEFEREKMLYTPRELPKKLTFVPVSECNTPSPQLKHATLGTYTPVSRGEGLNEISRMILQFKRMKDLSLEEINDGVRDDYFYGGQLRSGAVYLSIFDELKKMCKELLNKIEVDGATTIIPSPNSLPRFCYRTPINDLFIHNLILNEKQFTRCSDIGRAFPKKEDSIYGRSSEIDHLRTMGVYEPSFSGVDNVIIFDDVLTLGRQTTAIARIVRYLGYKGKFHVITLGKTG
ncbi:HAD family hydrolase [Candidatus Woesearchaeota archaeon]|nr:HAD family hydrolase [Candidatus Woesearchaeota archaeon]